MNGKKAVLYLLLGYPGAGKTTTSGYIHELTGAVHLWADKIRNERFSTPTHSHQENLELYDYLNRLTGELLATGQNVIFDTAFNFYKDRQHLRKIAEQHNAITKLIWVQTEKDLARERALNETHAVTNSYPRAMPIQRFERISNNLEAPRDDEPYLAIDGTKLSKEYIADLLRQSGIL